MNIGPGVQTGLTLLTICIIVALLSVMLMLLASADAFNGKVAIELLKDICLLSLLGAVSAFVGTGIGAIVSAHDSGEENDDDD